MVVEMHAFIPADSQERKEKLQAPNNFIRSCWMGGRSSSSCSQLLELTYKKRICLGDESFQSGRLSWTDSERVLISDAFYLLGVVHKINYCLLVRFRAANNSKFMMMLK